MAAEFHGLDLACSPGSVIPEGVGYENVAYQSCAIAGSLPGSLELSGDSYIAKSFGFSYSNVWRNFGILMLFTIAFIILAAWFSELFEWAEGSARAIEYKQSAKSKIKWSMDGRDEEEKPVAFDDRVRATVAGQTNVKDSEVPKNLSTNKSTFTWNDLSYTIPYDGNTKTLLNKVSGYCAPGQMIALVGSSGAGKTTRKFNCLY